MADDLSAFFAKKAQKSKDKKKKAVVNLDDVAQQLERKAKIQEQGEFDFDNEDSPKDGEFQKLGAKSTLEKRQQNDEDSEWIEYSEKPILKEINFRDFVEQPDEEIEEEKKDSNSDNVKTWNLVKEPVAEEPIVKPPVKSVYQAPGQARKAANLDLKNEEMFPSIGDADKIVEKIRTEEKKKATTPAKPEDQFETMKGPPKYAPPRGAVDRSARQMVKEVNWRSTAKPRAAPATQQSATKAEDEGNWSSIAKSRAAPATQQSVTKAEEEGSWRSTAKPRAAPATQQSPQRRMNAPAESQPVASTAQSTKPGAYVPPSMRNKT
ncbi:hypothetical protein DdX_08966 [Ditylenchus destructor]|uniref:Protein CDV3 homolog n=1 Tax=Ditylenchus destructor TaxID=166010 RepID=A0AAD4N5A6_9BILA|nr:hypothetical protein DdX_08966 [Ditylenchus destructor]